MQKSFKTDLMKNMTGFEQLLDMGDSSIKHKLSNIYELLLTVDADPFLPKKVGEGLQQNFYEPGLVYFTRVLNNVYLFSPP